MKIAVNICFDEPVPGIPIYYRLLLNQLVSSTPEHHFVFYTNEGFQFDTVPAAGIEVINLPPATGKLPLRKYTWQRRLNRQIMAGNSHLLINCNPFSSMDLPLPQLLLLDETTVELFTEGLKWHPRRSMIRNLQLASLTLISSQFDRKRLLAALRIQPSNTEIIGTGPQLEARQLSWEEKEKVKEQFAGGNEYFLLAPVKLKEEDIILLLKAFSMFKKRQQSSLKLLLPTKLVALYPAFIQKLGTYKFREDVVILPTLSSQEQLELIAAAYGIIDPTDHLYSSAMTLQAFESGSPVILSPGGRSMELAGEEAALPAQLKQPQDLASQMMLLYKDEYLRKRLIAAGNARLETHNWEQVVHKLKNALQALIPNS